MDDKLQHEYWEKSDYYRNYDHPVIREYSLQRTEYIRSFLPLEKIRTALDVGCGCGNSTYYMSGIIPHVCAVDYSENMLALHPMKKEGKVCMASAYELPFQDNSFDLVYGWEFLHHIIEPGRVVAEMARVSGKYVLICEPNPYNPLMFALALVDRENRWLLWYGLKFMRKLVRDAGLEVAHAGCGGWIFPNKTPVLLLPVIRRLPFRFFLGISNWVLGEKK